MIKIEHVALYCQDLEGIRSFYEKYFGCQSNEKYINEKKGFASYFLQFSEGSRLEIMTKTGMEQGMPNRLEYMGLTHLAISVGSKEKVDSLTEELRKDGYEVIGECRTTGDGYYESVVADPEGNGIEITI